MTTVSRFSLASELLCFSRFDEGEYTYFLNSSHTESNAQRPQLPTARNKRDIAFN